MKERSLPVTSILSGLESLLHRKNLSQEEKREIVDGAIASGEAALQTQSKQLLEAARQENREAVDAVQATHSLKAAEVDKLRQKRKKIFGS